MRRERPASKHGRRRGAIHEPARGEREDESVGRIDAARFRFCEARADEIHLVLSSVASAASLISTAERFAPAGATAMILTKLDEASALGHLLPTVRSARLPLSYLTNGQNVPDDIEPAEARRLAHTILDVERDR